VESGREKTDPLDSNGPITSFQLDPSAQAT
jgi:hypothetical protein